MTHGRITIITGSPGTGKSTVADKAAMESDMEKSVCIRTDDFFHYLKKGAIPPHLPESNAQNGVVIEAFLETAKRFVRGGYDVYVDGIVGPWFLEPWLGAAREGYDGCALHCAASFQRNNTETGSGTVEAGFEN